MLNTISTAAGINLEYVREEFYSFLPLNTVQYILKDDMGQEYYLVVSFDTVQDYFLEREAEKLPPLREGSNLIWSGEALGKRCSLYRMPSGIVRNFKDKTLSQKVIGQAQISEDTIRAIEADFLDSYPPMYRSEIQKLPEYKACFSMLNLIETVDIAEEKGFMGAEQAGIVGGDAMPLVCRFNQRFYQPVGYDEYVWKKISKNGKQNVRNAQFNQKKYRLVKRIDKIISDSRKPYITCEKWSKKDGHNERFALNNFAEIYPEQENYLLHIDTELEKSTLPVSFEGGEARLGTWMNPIGREPFLHGVKYIFRNFKGVKTVTYQNVLYDTLLDHGWKHNDFYLPLPKTVDELKSRLSQKGRYNLRRERRIIEEDFGGLCLDDVRYDEAPPELTEKFYALKGETHGITRDEYDITKRHITDMYVLRVGEGEIKGIAISCEQGEIVFLENHTFDSTERRYSFGQVLYDMYLDKMVEKEKTGVALAGGSLEYKKRYGTGCAIARSGEIKRHLYRFMSFADKAGIDIRSRLFRRGASKINMILGK